MVVVVSDCCLRISIGRKQEFQKVLLCDILNMVPAGFEPAPPKRTDLESVALDHSAIEPLLFVARHIWVSVFNKRRESCCVCL